jgi:hypothetical protein
MVGGSGHGRVETAHANGRAKTVARASKATGSHWWFAAAGDAHRNGELRWPATAQCNTSVLGIRSQY